MGNRLRLLLVVAVVLAVGALLGSALSQWWAPTPVREASEPTALFGERVRAEVLNGGGRNGMARQATDELRDRGVDVVYVGNAPEPALISQVVDRAGRLEVARRVALALGIDSVRSEVDPTLLLEVTIVLGPDWEPKNRPRP